MELANKNILVTGADGFIGSHLVEELVRRKAHVRALSYYNSFNHWGWLEAVDCLQDIEVISGDVRDFNLINQLCKNIDIIFHLAALIAIPYSYSAPQSYIETNVNGTLNICQAALNHQCSRIIHTSTSEVYGTADYVPIDENHPLKPQSPYSASKIGADAIARSFYYSFQLPLTIVRPFNTYGPRQSARAFIPSIITQILAGSTTISLGNLQPTRDLNYVKDTARGFAELAAADAAVGEVINLGSNQEISMLELSELIITLCHPEKPVKIVEDARRIRPAASEVERLKCDNSKLVKLIGFKPAFSLKKGLTETIDWFSKNIAKYKSTIYNV